MSQETVVRKEEQQGTVRVRCEVRRYGAVSAARSPEAARARTYGSCSGHGGLEAVMLLCEVGGLGRAEGRVCVCGSRRSRRGRGVVRRRSLVTDEGVGVGVGEGGALRTAVYGAYVCKEGDGDERRGNKSERKIYRVEEEWEVGCVMKTEAGRRLSEPRQGEAGCSVKCLVCG